MSATASDASAAIGALELADRDPAVAGMHAVATRLLALAFVEMGDLVAARHALESYDAVAGHAATTPHHYVRLARAALALAADDPALARTEAEALGAVARSAGTGTPSIPWRSLAALAAQRLGDMAAARALAGEQLELARAWGAPTDLGAAMRVVGRVEPDGRVTRFAGAVRTLERSPSRLELAHALADQGTALLVEGEDEAARAPLRRSSELAQACGAARLQAHVRETLAGLGDRQPEVTLAGAARLTPSERRIAELVAAGRSEREIAQELFVTPKSVAGQLERIHGRLGVSGRRELASLL